MPDSCSFCAPLDGPDLWRRVLFQTADSYTVATRGCLVPGYVLVVPRNHSLCSGQMSGTARRKLFEDASRVRKRTEELFGPSIIFEHGPAVAGSTVGCTIDHTHLHVVPAGNLRPIAEKLAQASWVDCSLEDLQRRYASGSSYVFLHDRNGMSCLDAGAAPSQLMRRALATTLGEAGRYDWRTNENPDNLRQTVEAWSRPLLAVANAA